MIYIILFYFFKKSHFIVSKVCSSFKSRLKMADFKIYIFKEFVYKQLANFVNYVVEILLIFNYLFKIENH